MHNEILNFSSKSELTCLVTFVSNIDIYEIICKFTWIEVKMADTS